MYYSKSIFLRQGAPNELFVLIFLLLVVFVLVFCCYLNDFLQKLDNLHKTALFSDISHKFGSSHLATNLGPPMGFPHGSVDKESDGQCRKHKRCSFDLWVRKILYKKEKATHFSILAWEIPWTDWHGNPSSFLQSHRMEFTNTQTLMVPSKQDLLKRRKVESSQHRHWEGFLILKDDAVKVLHSIRQQIWKTQRWPQDWKRSFSFQSQRKAMPKNAQTTTQLHSSHTLVK